MLELKCLLAPGVVLIVPFLIIKLGLVGGAVLRGSEAALMKEPAETSWKCLLHHRANAALSGRKQKIPGH